MHQKLGESKMLRQIVIVIEYPQSLNCGMYLEVHQGSLKTNFLAESGYLKTWFQVPDISLIVVGLLQYYIVFRHTQMT